jgi:hypothetical protein
VIEITSYIICYLYSISEHFSAIKITSVPLKCCKKSSLSPTHGQLQNCAYNNNDQFISASFAGRRKFNSDVKMKAIQNNSHDYFLVNRFAKQSVLLQQEFSLCYNITASFYNPLCVKSCVHIRHKQRAP